MDKTWSSRGQNVDITWSKRGQGTFFVPEHQTDSCASLFNKIHISIDSMDYEK